MIEPLLVSGLGALLLAVAGGLLTDVGPWYYALRKPSWQAPDWLFGPAWTIILGLAAWSAAIGWSRAADAATRWETVSLFGLNALLHFLWSPLFFKLRRPDWALIEVPCLWLSILVLMLFLAPFAKLASLALLPYLLWVTFATYLNWTIVRLNRPFPHRPASAATAP